MMQLDVNQSCRKARQIDYHRTKHLKLVLSRASEVGSPTNHPGSRWRQDTGLVIATYKNSKKKKNGPYIRPVFTKAALKDLQH